MLFVVDGGVIISSDIRFDCHSINFDGISKASNVFRKWLKY